MSVPSTKRRRRPSKAPSTEKPTVRAKRTPTKSTRKSRIPTTRTPLGERRPFSPVSSDQPPDGYFYLELISQDMHAVKDIERELLLRTTLAERCYMQSGIPVYRIPMTEAPAMKPWPFIQEQDKYAGCSLPANNKERETFVFRNRFSHAYLLNGSFETLRAGPGRETPSGAATPKNSASKSGNRRTRSRKRA